MPLSQVYPSQVVQPDPEEAGGFPGAGEGAHLGGGRCEDAGEGPLPLSWGCAGHLAARDTGGHDPSGSQTVCCERGGASVQQLAAWNPAGVALSQGAELASRWASPGPAPAPVTCQPSPSSRGREPPTSQAPLSSWNKPLLQEGLPSALPHPRRTGPCEPRGGQWVPGPLPGVGAAQVACSVAFTASPAGAGPCVGSASPCAP